MQAEVSASSCGCGSQRCPAGPGHHLPLTSASESWIIQCTDAELGQEAFQHLKQLSTGESAMVKYLICYVVL